MGLRLDCIDAFLLRTHTLKKNVAQILYECDHFSGVHIKGLAKCSYSYVTIAYNLGFWQKKVMNANFLTKM